MLRIWAMHCGYKPRDEEQWKLYDFKICTLIYMTLRRI